MSRYIDSTTFVIATALTLLWIFPTVVSPVMISILLTWVYGILAARILRMILQGAIMRWGMNRGGVIMLGFVMTIIGAAIIYFGYQESLWFYTAIGWIIGFAGFDSALAAYRGRIKLFYIEMINDAQYLLVSLFALALFGGNIVQSQIASLGLEYQGVPGESLIFLALAMAWAEIAHGVGMYIESTIEKIFDR
ncbi:MAG: hypothetical protein ACKKL4_02060 [Patescibacteria group bacterium]